MIMRLVSFDEAGGERLFGNIFSITRALCREAGEFTTCPAEGRRTSHRTPSDRFKSAVQLTTSVIVTTLLFHCSSDEEVLAVRRRVVITTFQRRAALEQRPSRHDLQSRNRGH